MMGGDSVSVPFVGSIIKEEEEGRDALSPMAKKLVRDARRALFKPNMKFANTVKQVQTAQQLKVTTIYI
jgi:hypothetical protein